jgi:aspartate aminotransferase
MFLLEKAHVAVVPGAAFGDDRFIRISYATSDDILKEAFRRIGDALSLLR